MSFTNDKFDDDGIRLVHTIRPYLHGICILKFAEKNEQNKKQPKFE